MNVTTAAARMGSDGPSGGHYFFAFHGHSLAQQDALPLMNRVDKKFLINIRDLPAILQFCQAHYSVLRIQGQTGMDYRTTYYDTPDMAFFMAHHNGVLPRKKIRTREYLNTGERYAEVKIKTHKFRTIKTRELISGDNSAALTRRLLPAHYIRPTLEVCYTRCTLLGQQPGERITFDFSLSCINCHSGQHFNNDNVVIIEIKQNSTDRSSPIFSALKAAGYRSINFSKYCNGCVFTQVEGIKHNRFKWQARAFRRIAEQPQGSQL